MSIKTRIETIEEIIFTLKDSIERIAEIQTEVDSILYDTDIVNNYEAYGKYGFDQLLGNGNPHDNGLPSLVEHFGSQLDELLEKDYDLNREHENKYNKGEKCSDECPTCLGDSKVDEDQHWADTGSHIEPTVPFVS